VRVVAQRSCSVRLARRLLLVGLALILAGCGDGGGGPVIGSPSPTTGPTSSGNTGPTSAPTVTLSPTTAADPGVGIQVGGPSLQIPNNGPPPVQLSLGEVAVGESSERVVKLNSSADFAITVEAVRVQGDAGFRLRDDGCSGVTLPSQGSGGCSYTVAFSPEQGGAAQGSVVVAMVHRCTATTYAPCSWGPDLWRDRGPGNTREVLPSGQEVFNWTSVVLQLNGTGTTAAPSTS
jgi:hypothetical protein